MEVLHNEWNQNTCYAQKDPYTLGDDYSPCWYDIVNKKRENKKGIKFQLSNHGITHVDKLFNSYKTSSDYFQPILVGDWYCKDTLSYK